MVYPTPETLSPSQISTYMTCEQRWEFNYVQGLVPVGPDWVHFAKGNYLHELCHYYYAMVDSGIEVGSPLLLEAIKFRILEDLQEAPNPDVEFYQMCMRTMLRYVEHRSPVIDANLSQIKYESHLEREIDGRVLHGFADLIYFDTDEKCWVIRDHKTGGRNVYTMTNVHRNGQLLFYGALFHAETGEVPKVEINWINSQPPKNPGKTLLWATYRVHHTETVYKNYLEYLHQVHERQTSVKPLRNLMACGSCPYHLICSSDLKELSTDLIIKSRYGRKDSLSEKDSEEALESD